MTEFRYLTAKEWGMWWARLPIAEKLLDPECFVHHSAGNHVDDAVQAFRNLNAYAINSKGYSALDYDVLVHRNKQTGLVTIGEGRGPWMSAATYNRNEEGEAVCLLGYFHPGHSLSRKPHPDELEGVALAIVWAMVEGWVSPNTKIMGHRDNPAAPGATGCPGDYLQAELPTIRARVAQLTNPDEDDMLILPKPYRSFDSRNTRGPLLPGETITVPVGQCSKATVRIGSIGQGGDGFLFVNGAADTSLANFTHLAPINSDTVPVLTPNGKITISAEVSKAHFTVDVYAVA